MDRKFDIVVYGATSFVGEIIAAHMMRQHGGDGSVHWAIAGRSEEKLVALKEKIGAEEIPHIVADSDDEKSLVDLAKQTKVVLTTVGPYALYGELLLKVCAETGTDYCDLTGEVQWYRKMLLKYEDQAKQSGARIMPCSGFDSMPSDLGVYFLQEQAKKRFGDRCHRVKARVEKIRGGASGGSAMSFLNVAKEMAQDPVVKKEMHNPYALCPKGHNYTVVQNEIDYAEFDDDFDSWIGTFMMSKVNTRIVHRSNALMDDVYGADFTYDEAMLLGAGPKGKSRARKMSFGFRMFFTFSPYWPINKMLKRLMPKVGEGPSEEQQRKGLFVLRFLGHTKKNETLEIVVRGDRDPGYGSTAKMISEAAYCLAALPDSVPGGFWTPSALLGEKLIDRLHENAGVTFEIASNS